MLPEDFAHVTPGEFYSMVDGFARRERRLLEKVALIVSYLGQFKRPVSPKELLQKWLGDAGTDAPSVPISAPPDTLSLPVDSGEARAEKEEKFARLLSELNWKRARAEARQSGVATED